jgi:lysine 6-dehydrogenase
MNVIVLGLGLQGKAVVHDLEKCDRIDQIIVGETQVAAAEAHIQKQGYTKTRIVAIDATREADVNRLIQSSGAGLVVCMLPPDFGLMVARAAIGNRAHFVSSSYTGKVAELDALARDTGVALLPEMGMDPGIDLVLARLAIEELDEVHGLYSYGAGLPEPEAAAENPLRYKITWTFEGVLKAYKRPARILKDGQEVSIPGDEIFFPENGHRVEVPGLGSLEAYPNGDAIHYIDVFNLKAHIRDMGRFALRYPGHSRFWATMAKLGFLDDTPMAIGGASASPRDFLVAHLTPRLQFNETERDVVILRVDAWGIKNGRQHRCTYSLIDYRDLDTGLFAMNRTVGYTTAIGAQMIVSGKISAAGLLSPTRDVPARELLQALKARGMKIDHRVEETEPI